MRRSHAYWTFLGWLGLVGGLLGPHRAAAEAFILKDGTTIEGRLIAKEDDAYKVRTLAGIIMLPIARVERVESQPTVFDEYDSRRAQAKDTAEAQTELALWCGEQELRAEEQAHLERALALDPNYGPARRAAGFVRVGGVWVEARTAQQTPAPATKPAETEEDKELRARVSTWYVRLRAIRSQSLESARSEQRERGRARVLAIDDPLAIEPMADLLGRGKLYARQVLLEALQRFPQGTATKHIAALALVEPDRDLREAAVAELKRRHDPRVVAQFRKALRQDNDRVLRNAAYALGELGAHDAIGDLTRALTLRRVGTVEIPVQDYFVLWNDDWQGGYGPVQQRAGEVRLMWPLEVTSEWVQQPLVQLRTEVREALVKLTGQDFGFDNDAWQRWLLSQTETVGGGSTDRGGGD